MEAARELSASVDTGFQILVVVVVLAAAGCYCCGKETLGQLTARRDGGAYRSIRDWERAQEVKTGQPSDSLLTPNV